MDNVLLTPHIAGASDRAQIVVKQRTCRNVARALVGDCPRTRDLINPAALAHPRHAVRG
jgi:phosphoglycerate dehydrogenase-like enzyme